MVLSLFGSQLRKSLWCSAIELDSSTGQLDFPLKCFETILDIAHKLLLSFPLHHWSLKPLETPFAPLKLSWNSSKGLKTPMKPPSNFCKFYINSPQAFWNLLALETRLRPPETSLKPPISPETPWITQEAIWCPLQLPETHCNAFRISVKPLWSPSKAILKFELELTTRTSPDQPHKEPMK